MKYLYLILLISNLYSFEVNTHQAITKCAIENIKKENSTNNACNKQDRLVGIPKLELWDE